MSISSQTTTYGDILLVSYLPFSKKKEVLARLIQLDKPFITVFPTQSINEDLQIKSYSSKDDKIQINYIPI